MQYREKLIEVIS